MFNTGLSIKKYTALNFERYDESDDETERTTNLSEAREFKYFAIYDLPQLIVATRRWFGNLIFPFALCMCHFIIFTVHRISTYYIIITIIQLL